MAEKQFESFRSSLEEKISKAYSRMEETQQQTELYREGIIPQTSQSLQAALSSYQVGKVPFMSLLNALMTTYQTEMEYYRVSTEYMRSLAWLEAETTLPLIGLPVPLPENNSTISQE
jgi:cobalt-zinc-cadmium efflux system outer membrane protein